jgi:pyruvate/2-oxoglutarate dehydrogenase complex dihydrolipoamide acyltransferase (E2) component
VCWKSCGNCAGEGAFVTEVLIAPGDEIRFNQVIVRTETSKVSTDVPTTVAGRVVSVHVQVGDELGEDTLIARVERA